MKSSLVFLTYLSRSGSTYLASQLNKYEDIGVSIEAEFIDGWINAGFDVDSELKLNDYIDTLYSDRKFQQWNLDKTRLSRQIRKYPFPVKFSEILYECLSEYFKPETYPIMIYKGGHYYRCIDKIRKEHPQAKFIFVDRDPRAIYSSQKKSLDSRTGLPMLQNILHFAFGYIETQKIINTYIDSDYLQVIKYENLVLNGAAEITRVLDFLGVARKEKASSRSYIDAVPAAQKHLHKNVELGKPKTDRISGWQEELPAEDIFFLETVLKPWLVAKEYDFSDKRSVSLRRQIVCSMNIFRFVYEDFKRRLIKIKHKY